MPSAEDFDEFYVQTRRRLLLQAFALTGDLGAARVAVKDAYVAARHHWNKVGRLDDPESWVRPRAWAAAQRRHSARPWHREKKLTEQQVAVLEALHKLPDAERKTLLLTHLAALPLPEIGREIGVTQERVEHHLQSATATLALALDIDSTGVRAALQSLEPAVSGARLPRAPLVRRSGIRRRRLHAVLGSAALVLTTIGAGTFVVQGATADRDRQPEEKPKELVPRSALLRPGTLAQATGDQQWQMKRTDDNTQGSGINSLCQSRRFADEEGIGTWVRRFQSPGKPARKLIQTVDISASPGAAQAAYKTTRGWFAGCQNARLQLLNAYRVTGVGDQAELLLLRIPDETQRSYFVGISRTGSLTVSTLVETDDGRPPSPAAVTRTLASSVRGLCDTEPAGACVNRPRARPVLPPPSGEGRGMLAVADLPIIEKVKPRWVGTPPAPARGTPSATTCERAQFRKAGALGPRTRTFLIPKAKQLPKRFGITQTVARFKGVPKARKFVENVTGKMAACPDEQLSSTVPVSQVVPKGVGDSQYGLWRLESQIDKAENKVAFWTGVARVGPYVTQVTFAPVEGADVDEQTFRALLTRARDRLNELKKSS